MRDILVVEDRLRRLSKELEERGVPELVREVGEIMAIVRQQAEEPEALMTTGEAAHALGIRSINTIKRWAADGLLDGVRRGGRLMVRATSVERLENSPTVAQQRAGETRIQDALEPLDAGNEEIPPLKATHVGRKPWERTIGANR